MIRHDFFISKSFFIFKSRFDFRSAVIGTLSLLTISHRWSYQDFFWDFPCLSNLSNPEDVFFLVFHFSFRFFLIFFLVIFNGIFRVFPTPRKLLFSTFSFFFLLMFFFLFHIMFLCVSLIKFVCTYKIVCAFVCCKLVRLSLAPTVSTYIRL